MSAPLGLVEVAGIEPACSNALHPALHAYRLVLSHRWATQGAQLSID
jgi:hypothetical protein